MTVLTDPFVSWLLLFVGLFMLVLELKLPGIGLPAITSALAFLLFFWSHYLSGTADQLEIILFLVGLVCLALELFVFPGFGVFGMSGVLLILTSIVMASHTFVWPTQEYEYRELGYTLIQVTVAMVAVGGGRGGPGALLPVAAAVQPPGPEARALDRASAPRTRSRKPLAGGLRFAGLPDRRDRPHHHRAPPDGQGPVRRAPDRRHRRRLLHRARQPGRGRRRPGLAGDRQAGSGA